MKYERIEEMRNTCEYSQPQSYLCRCDDVLEIIESLDEALGALADIALSTDVSLEGVKAKALRIYNKIKLKED